MKVIPPVVYGDAHLISSTVAEPDATAAGDGLGATEWTASATYAANVVVTRGVGFTHRAYKSVAGGNIGNIPENSLTGMPAKWVDVGSTNRWKMLAADANSRTVSASPLTVVIKPGMRISALSIMSVEADSVLVEMRDPSGTVVYSHTETLDLRVVNNWDDYFFAEFGGPTSLLLLDLPSISGASVTVRLTSSSGTVTCGAVVIGVPVDLGSTATGASSGAIDFSRIVRDAFGNSSLLERKAVPRTSQTTLLDKSQVNLVRRTLLSLRAKTALYFGIDDDSHGYFDSLCVLGIAKQWDLALDQPEHATLSIDIEGL